MQRVSATEWELKLKNAPKSEYIGFDGVVMTKSKTYYSYGYGTIERHFKIIDGYRFYLDFMTINVGGCPCCGLDKPHVIKTFSVYGGNISEDNKPLKKIKVRGEQYDFETLFSKLEFKI